MTNNKPTVESIKKKIKREDFQISYTEAIELQDIMDVEYYWKQKIPSFVMNSEGTEIINEKGRTIELLGIKLIEYDLILEVYYEDDTRAD